MHDKELIELLKESADVLGLDEWLKELASTCVEHMRYLDEMEDEDPAGLSVEDYSMLELERGFLTLYAHYTKGGLPDSDNTNEH